MLLLCMSCLTCPLLCHTGALVPASQKAVEIPSVAVLRQGFGHARRGATTGAGLDVQTTAELPQLQFSVKSVVIPRCSSWTRLCSCAQPVETPQAQFFSFWALYTGTGPGAPVMRTGAGWRRRPGVVSRGGWHLLISCMLFGVYGETHMSYNSVCTTTTTTTYGD